MCAAWWEGRRRGGLLEGPQDAPWPAARSRLSRLPSLPVRVCIETSIQNTATRLSAVQRSNVTI